MVKFDKFILDNGLKVIVHKDVTTPIIALNILYNVGAKDENPDKTGFAHLFEHLMFGGSKNIPSYDGPLQLVGGENNAFTSNDITNYYLTLPKANIETGFWLESDRMLCLDFNQQSLEVQRNVVIEEFKQRYLNQPFGDMWLHMRPLAYKKHPYKWATIGKDISHIESARLQDVKDFFFSFYAPDNAILVVAGNIETNEVEKLTKKWFGPIERRNVNKPELIAEPQQTKSRELEVEGDVPCDSIYKAFHMCGKTHQDYQTADLISDILSNGNSSRLYQSLVKEQKLFSDINAYILGSHDPGLLMISGKLIKGVKMNEAEDAINKETEKLMNNQVDDNELNKVKNKVEASITFSNLSVLNKAMKLSFSELIGNAYDINTEADNYLKVTPQNIQRLSRQVLDKSNCSTLYYYAKK